MSILIVRYSEIGIKGKSFVRQLANNIRHALKPFSVQLQTEFHQIRIDVEDQTENEAIALRTYPISIQNAQDCYTIFQPQLTTTSSYPALLQKTETSVDLSHLTKECLTQCKVLFFSSTR